MSVLPDVLLRTSVEPGARSAPSSAAPQGEAFADVYAAQRKPAESVESKGVSDELQANDVTERTSKAESEVDEVAEDGNVLPQEEGLTSPIVELLDTPLWAMLQQTTPTVPVDPAQTLLMAGYVPPVVNAEVSLDAELEALTSAKTSQSIVALEPAEPELPTLALSKLLSTSVAESEVVDEVGFKLEALTTKVLANQEPALGDASNRLTALAQAVSSTTQVAPRPVLVPGTPLVPQQAGFSEAVTDRVMWMSSQNLKTAHIQLDPAELGRLEVRVNVSGEQTHVMFSSAHANVRDALESQMQRLRELFSQQGLGQPDVDVSDRSNQQARQEAASFVARGHDDDVDEVDTAQTLAVDSGQRAEQVGAGLVDYYA